MPTAGPSPCGVTARGPGLEAHEALAEIVFLRVILLGLPVAAFDPTGHGPFRIGNTHAGSVACQQFSRCARRPG